jgi:hypothetical protein
MEQVGAGKVDLNHDGQNREGVAAVETFPGSQLESLKHDFNLINKLLADLARPV